MQFGSAIFLAAVIGIAGAVLASLSLLFWRARSPRDRRPDEKLLLSNWKRMKKAETSKANLSRNTEAI
jgi:hypothetical protein